MTDETSAAADEIAAAAISDGAYTLIAADFADVDIALEAYQALKDVEDGATVKIEGVVVVKRDADGKLEVQRSPITAPERALADHRPRRRSSCRSSP